MYLASWTFDVLKEMNQFKINELTVFLRKIENKLVLISSGISLDW